MKCLRGANWLTPCYSVYYANQCCLGDECVRNKSGCGIQDISQRSLRFCQFRRLNNGIFKSLQDQICWWLRSVCYSCTLALSDMNSLVIQTSETLYTSVQAT